MKTVVEVAKSLSFTDFSREQTVEVSAIDSVFVFFRRYLRSGISTEKPEFLIVNGEEWNVVRLVERKLIAGFTDYLPAHWHCPLNGVLNVTILFLIVLCQTTFCIH